MAGTQEHRPLSPHRPPAIVHVVVRVGDTGRGCIFLSVNVFPTNSFSQNSTVFSSSRRFAAVIVFSSILFGIVAVRFEPDMELLIIP